MLPDVGLADILREARIWRHPEERAEAAARGTVDSILAALDAEVIPASSPTAGLVRRRACEVDRG